MESVSRFKGCLFYQVLGRGGSIRLMMSFLMTMLILLASPQGMKSPKPNIEDYGMHISQYQTLIRRISPVPGHLLLSLFGFTARILSSVEETARA